LSVLFVFAAVAFSVVCGDVSTSQQKLNGRTIGECESGVTYEIDEKSMTFTASGTGTLQRCNPPNAREIKKVVINEGITKLGYGSLALGAFQDWYSLSSVEIPNSLTAMESNAFRSTSLTSFHVTKALTQFDGSAFWNCTKLTEITVDEENSQFSGEDGILFDKSKRTIVRYPPGKAGKKYAIPDTVVKIAKYCFQNCLNLEVVTIPTAATTIEMFAFHTTGLIKIIIPASVKTIGGSAFYFEDDLSYVKYLGDTDPYDGTSTIFNYCPQLDSICVESSYKSDKFCNVTVSKDCPDPPPDPSEPSSDAGFIIFPSIILALASLVFLVMGF